MRRGIDDSRDRRSWVVAAVNTFLFASLLLNVYFKSQPIVLKQTPLGPHSEKFKIKISCEGSFGFVFDALSLPIVAKQ